MKKIGLICLALVLALGTIGVGFATWIDVLYIEGTVNTGTVDVELSEGVASDDEVKDWVSGITCTVTGDTLFVTVTNAYPCITYSNTFDVHMLGSVPVILSQSIDLTGVPAGAVISVTGIDGVQLDYPSDEAWGLITVHIDNIVPQSSSFSFTVTITATQYNKA